MEAKNGKMICNACGVNIEFSNSNLRSHLQQHLRSMKHKSRENTQPNQMIDIAIKEQGKKEIEKEKFGHDLLEMCLETGIPLHKVRTLSFNHFIRKWTSQTIPSETTLRRRVGAVAQEKIEKIKLEIGDKNVYFIVDETCDKECRNVVNILVGTLNRKPSRAMLLDVQFQTCINNETIQDATLKACSILWPGSHVPEITFDYFRSGKLYVGGSH